MTPSTAPIPYASQHTNTNQVEESTTTTTTIDFQESSHKPINALTNLKVLKFPRNTSDRDIVHSIIKSRKEKEEACFIVNLSKIEQQIQYMRDLLPRVHPFYAVKCNPNKKLLAKLHELGVSYDCASMQEMKLVEHTVNLHNDHLRQEYFANNVVFANPCKQVKHILHAKAIGVQWIVVDGINEMKKMHRHYPEAKIVIRIKVDDSTSKMQFSVKFGASLDECPKMLRFAQEHNLNVVGCSFHVGSGCLNAEAYIGALERAKTLFDMGKEYGYQFDLLDIGGGMPGTETGSPTFKEIADTIREPLDDMFDPASVRVIAEPGRFIATQSHILVTNIFSKKEKTEGTEPNFVYYLNESVYGSFGCILFDHATPQINIYGLEDEDLPTYPSTIFGCTCDSVDLIYDKVHLPEMHEGQWLYFCNFGAYTKASSSKFNGFSTQKYIYVEEE
eukprot:CAMPEP_0117448404 /NCGR_PEP_ID=MMETSP0759-20121206/7382_1 /TAXON_ID=63605 /ORGANISM="Percolomonas cosmopolitus, Strain WS" /LENGTH=445 /DNA_ID=CAMNT_0005240787 /DNA_START=35 /DNA_END=1372 /DNA_ORIENTATION=+